LGTPGSVGRQPAGGWNCTISSVAGASYAIGKFAASRQAIALTNPIWYVRLRLIFRLPREEEVEMTRLPHPPAVATYCFITGVV
jgi:hypothetical protein